MFEAQYDSDDAYLQFSSDESEGEDDGGEEELAGKSRSTLMSQATGGTELCHNFEQDMEDELDATMQGVIQSALGPSTAAAAGGKVRGQKTDADKDKSSKKRSRSGSNAGTSDDGASASDFYDDVYFDSGSDEEEGRHCVADGASAAVKPIARAIRPQRRRRVPVMTNEDLFYDPDIDNDNELWMANKLRSNRGVRPVKRRKSKSGTTAEASTLDSGCVADDEDAGGGVGGRGPVPRSDALLSCPACLTTLCVDCQRHDVYCNQYRAMFVVNCVVKHGQVLKYKPRDAQKKGRAKKRKTAQPAEQESNDSVQRTEHAGPAVVPGVATDECYEPVVCGQCSTEVAVYDKDELYHFFNVLAGHA